MSRYLTLRERLLVALEKRHVRLYGAGAWLKADAVMGRGAIIAAWWEWVKRQGDLPTML